MRNDTSISTENNLGGDPVQATVVEPVLFASQELLPIGTRLTGRLCGVKKPGRLKGTRRTTARLRALGIARGGKVYSLRVE